MAHNGHTDFYARFARPAFDSDELAAGYIEYYVANGFVLMHNFGDATSDQQANAVLQGAY